MEMKVISRTEELRYIHERWNEPYNKGEDNEEDLEG